MSICLPSISTTSTPSCPGYVLAGLWKDLEPPQQESCQRDIVAGRRAFLSIDGCIASLKEGVDRRTRLTQEIAAVGRGQVIEPRVRG
jgi:hypothetical protein